MIQMGGKRRKIFQKLFSTNVSGGTLEMGEEEAFLTVVQAPLEREAQSQGRIGR